VNLTRLMVFCVSAFIAGIGGAMYITQFTVGATVFQPLTSLILIAVLAISAILGTRVLLSSGIAALLYEVVPGYFTHFNTDWQTLSFGILAIIAGLLLANRPALLTFMKSQTTARGDRTEHSPITERLLHHDDFVALVGS
jgi:ABC-type branched-subunit amino acid transport system permease subunit